MPHAGGGPCSYFPLWFEPAPHQRHLRAIPLQLHGLPHVVFLPHQLHHLPLTGPGLLLEFSSCALKPLVRSLQALHVP